LDTESIIFRVAYSRDLQRTRSTNAEYSDATENSIKALNKELKEPSQIVFLLGAFTNVLSMTQEDGIISLN